MCGWNLNLCVEIHETEPHKNTHAHIQFVTHYTNLKDTNPHTHSTARLSFPQDDLSWIYCPRGWSGGMSFSHPLSHFITHTHTDTHVQLFTHAPASLGVARSHTHTHTCCTVHSKCGIIVTDRGLYCPPKPADGCTLVERSSNQLFQRGELEST